MEIGSMVRSMIMSLCSTYPKSLASWKLSWYRMGARVWQMTFTYTRIASPITTNTYPLSRVNSKLEFSILVG